MAGTWTGSRTWIAAFRGGFLLLTAFTVLPMTTVPISSGRRPDRWRAALMAVAPSSTAEISFNAPPNVPMAVRTGSAITIECFDVMENLRREHAQERRVQT